MRHKPEINDSKIKVLKALRDYKDGPPTIREVAEQVGLTPKYVHDMYRELMQDEYITLTPNKSRSAKFTLKGSMYMLNNHNECRENH